MKTVSVLLCAMLALAGCATKLEERSHGSWLDQMGKPKPDAGQLTAAERVQMGQELSALQQEAEATRAKLAAETSRLKRIEYLRELRDLGDEARPIQQALREGKQLPPKPVFVEHFQAGG